MASLTDIRDAIAANLSAITDFQVSAWMLANPTAPSGHVFPGPTTFDVTAGRGFDQLELLVQIFVAQNSDRGAQENLDEYMAGSGARSVKQALESDPTLGGACADLRVTGCSGYRQFVFEGRAPLLGAEWTVDIYAPGN